jgi:hypothetical protein
MGWIRLMVEYTIPQAIKNKIAHTRKSICLLNSAEACLITLDRPKNTDFRNTMIGIIATRIVMSLYISSAFAEGCAPVPRHRKGCVCSARVLKAEFALDAKLI